ncbi:YciI family protein [Saccharospirillum mangrovi]|uniref:YciI family protein n=1 Tax=Saccharospirillum mangrovi TaxID=2161747 RepID=UPI000D3D0CA5|nr:YciI family protein [Saccharospirillum mangrovi]
MRFMIIRKADADTEAGILPESDLLEAMGRYNEALVDAGVWRGGEGLKPSREAFRIEFNGGEPEVIDGPFAETRELLGGYTMIETKSVEEALEWAKRWPREDGNFRLELRPVYTLEDFEPSEGLNVHRDLDARIARQSVSQAVHLSFEGNCREALNFYADLLGGRLLTISTYGDAPEPAPVPDDWSDKIIHSELSLGDLVIMGVDAPPAYFDKPQGVSVQLSFDSVEKSRYAFDQLVEGGRVRMPFEKTFWSAGFGMLTDRFGIHWMISTV